MRLEKPLIFNLVGLAAIACAAWKSPQLLALLPDMALGTAIAVCISHFARQQAAAALPQDYD